MELIEITNKAGRVKLSDSVHKFSMDRLLEEIGSIFGARAAAKGDYTGELTNCAENAVDTLEIEINSPGGSVLDGYTLFSEIKKMQARGVYVTATINPLAASMASVIAMAADHIRMIPTGRMMIHDVQTGVSGNAETLMKNAKIIDEMSDEIAAIYAEKTGSTSAAMRKKMKEETWMSAKVALAEGFIDEIYDPASKKNSIDIEKVEPTRGHMKFLDRLTSPSSEEATARIAALEATIAGHDQVIQGYEDKLGIAEAALAEVELLKTENTSLTQKLLEIPTLEAKLADKDAEIANLTEKAEITAEKISAAAAEKLAAMGHGEALDLGKSDVTGKQNPKNLTLAEFNNLSPAEKMKFSKKGGRLTE